ncbi:MAG: fluoride efflux transporter CrcB [Hyphomicrobiales bacterium]
MLHVLAVAVGGALGGMARFWVSEFVARRLQERFPWGTLVVNVTGSALIGVAAGLALSPEEPAIGPSSWALLVIGVLGSYTTVSSFSLQTLVLFHAGYPGRAVGNVAASLSLCLAAAAAAWVSVDWMVA